MQQNNFLIEKDDPILVTGAAGFIGARVVKTLIDYGFTSLRCLVRPSSNTQLLTQIISQAPESTISIYEGNLLSKDDCVAASSDASVIFHLAAGVEKSFAGCIMNSAVGTRNLLDAAVMNDSLKRFVNISSIAVYSYKDLSNGEVLFDTDAIDSKSYLRHEAYTYGKVKQDQIVFDYHEKYNLPFVIVRPGDVFGPGKNKISGRVGIDTFGFFLHLGGNNDVPLTYHENCAEAIVLAGIRKGVNGEIFIIVDDDLPSSKFFLKQYKKRVKSFFSVRVHYYLFYLFCLLWEKYAHYSAGQLPPAFNTHRCVANWKNINFSNNNAKSKLNWQPKVPMSEALNRYYSYMKERI